MLQTTIRFIWGPIALFTMSILAKVAARRTTISKKARQAKKLVNKSGGNNTSEPKQKGICTSMLCVGQGAVWNYMCYDHQLHETSRQDPKQSKQMPRADAWQQLVLTFGSCLHDHDFCARHRKMTVDKTFQHDFLWKGFLWLGTSPWKPKALFHTRLHKTCNWQLLSRWGVFSYFEKMLRWPARNQTSIQLTRKLFILHLSLFP